MSEPAGQEGHLGQVEQRPREEVARPFRRSTRSSVRLECVCWGKEVREGMAKQGRD